MANQFIQVPPDSTGKKIDSSELTVAAETVQRQRFLLADDSVAAGLAKVTNGTPGGSDYGLVVRPVGTVSITSNSAVNAAQVAGTNVDTNSGNKSAGTQRFVIATDQPQLTAALKVDGSAVTQPVSGSVSSPNTTGDVAHDGVNSGNPVQIAVEAIAHGTNPTAVAAADRTKLYANRAGIPFVIGGHPNVVCLEVEYTGAQTNAAIVTIGAGLKIVVTRITVVLDADTTVTTGFRIGFATATTPTTTGVVASHPGLVPGGGITIGDGSGMLGVGADNEDLRITSEAPTTGALRIVVTYYTIES